VSDQRSPTSVAKTVTECLLLAAIIVSVQLIGMGLLVPSGGNVIFYPQAGIGIGWLLARGPRAWPGVLIGAALGDALILYAEAPIIIDDMFALCATALSQGVADLLTALTIYFLARWLLRWPITLLRPREILLFICVVIPTGVMLGTAWDYLTLYAANRTTTAPAWQFIAEEFVSTGLGAIACSMIILVALGEPREVWRKRRAMAVFIPVAYVGIVWGAVAVGTSLRNEKYAEFRTLVANAVSELEIDLASHEMVASAATAFYASSNLVERDEFASFIRPLQARLPNVQAVSWDPLVLAGDRDAFVTAARAEGLADFEIFERTAEGQRVDAGSRPEYFPIWFIEPLAGNQAAVGFDLFSEPTRHAAIIRARQAGRPVASAPVRLVQARNELGVLLLAPIKTNESGQFSGLVSVVLNATRICARVGGLLGAEHVHFSVTDESAPAAEGLLFSAARLPSDFEDAHDEFKVIRDVEFGTRRWRTQATSTSGYLAASSAWGFLAEYGSFAILLAMITAAQLYTSGRDLLVEAVVTERSQELLLVSERFRGLIDAAPTALLAVSASGKVVMANREALQLFGYSLDQLLGQSPNLLLAPRTGANSIRVDVVQLRETAGTLPRILLCQSRNGEQFRVQVRQSLSNAEGGQLTVVSLTEVSSGVQGSLS
jgi:PAS domain S-box-containing protein